MVFVFLAVLFQVIMIYTVYGKRSYAIGSNEAAPACRDQRRPPQGAGLHDRAGC